MTTTYGGYTVDQLREFIRHHYDAEHGGDNIDELTRNNSASVNIVRDLLDAIEPPKGGDLLAPVARWVYSAVRVNLDLLHGICSEFGCRQGDDVAQWLRARLSGAPIEQPAASSNDERSREFAAVDMFAAAMKAKLDGARAKGRSGWEQCAPADLSRMLREHVEKGDPRDVANFCMFLWALGKPITAPAQADARNGLTDSDLRCIAQVLEGSGYTGTMSRVRALLAAHPGQPEPRAEVTFSEWFEREYPMGDDWSRPKYRATNVLDLMISAWNAARTGASS